MTLEQYRIDSPTIAMFLEDERRVTHTVPEGSMITVDVKTLDGDKLVEVTWAGKVVMMFTQDIRSRGKKIR